jgi:hypothetical protein
MMQENLPLKRLAQAVAAAERADKRLLEKPLNDLVTEIKVRGLIAKMVLVTAQQTLRALPMAEERRELAEVDAVGEPVVEPAVVDEALKAVSPVPKPKAPAKRTHSHTEWVPPYISHPHLPPSKRILMYPRPLTPLDLANEVGVNRETMYLWIKAGTVPFRLAGRHYKIDPGPAAEWAEQCEFLPPRQK